MSNSHMQVNVIASTSGIEIATTSPVRRPRLTSDTARTMITASASERTKSLTERCTALGMLATASISTPAGSRAPMRFTSASSAWPSSITSPPFAIVIPRPSVSRPWKRIFCCGGSA